ncbi:MAG: metallophosphoesterase, partial [Candidatus Pacebacteria bacterium]|nr:metallophosphoesterase [Candidatus Paceibacterota bacterium]
VLKRFIDTNTKNKFRCAKWNESFCLSIKNVPFVAFNSCIGGTEHAYFDEPKQYWKAVEVNVRQLNKKFFAKEKIKALDIPAIGKTQLDYALRFLNNNHTNFAVILTHHNPFPVPLSEYRQYASLIDSGKVLHMLVQNNRFIILLHGHAHIDCGISADLLLKGSGKVVALGNAGLNNEGDAASAVYLQLLIKDNKFLAASILRLVKRGIIFQKMEEFDILGNDDSIVDLEIEKLGRQTNYTFEAAAKLLRKKNEKDDDLLEKLIKFASKKTVTIEGLKENSFAKLSIIRN